MTIGENIKRYRIRKHMTQAELADAVGVTHRMLQKYEAPEDASNSVIPSVNMVRKIAQILEVNISKIIEDSSFVDESTSLNHFYDKLTEEFALTDILDLNKDRVKKGLIFYIYKSIYIEYRLKEQTGMDAFDFYLIDSTFAQDLYDQIVSYTIGTTLRNLVKIKIGKNKPITKETIKYKELLKKDFNTIHYILNYFADKELLDELLSFALIKEEEYNNLAAAENSKSAERVVKRDK